MKEKSKERVELKVDDLQRAEKGNIKSVKDSHFSKEINSLQTLVLLGAESLLREEIG